MLLHNGREVIKRCRPFAVAATALLSACAMRGESVTLPPTHSASAVVLHRQQTFAFTGAEQTFVVPSGVTAITVVARGAAGAGFSAGRGARAFAVLPVRPGERLAVYVGGAGTGGTGGFNGGADGGRTIRYGQRGDGGGGASDVREHGDRLTDRILVAAGGGGQGALNEQHYGGGGKGGRDVGGVGGAGWHGIPRRSTAARAATAARSVAAARAVPAAGRARARRARAVRERSAPAVTAARARAAIKAEAAAAEAAVTTAAAAAARAHPVRATPAAAAEEAAARRTPSAPRCDSVAGPDGFTRHTTVW